MAPPEEKVETPLMVVHAPNPSTVRGNPLQMSFHPKIPQKVLYPMDKYVIMRDLEDPTKSDTYTEHSAKVTVARFAPNGNWVASGDQRGKVRIWAFDHPEHILKKEISAFNGPVVDICWGPESRRIIVVGDGKEEKAKAFTWDTGNSLGNMVGHNRRVTAVDFKPSRPYRAITAGDDFQLCFYEGPPFKFKHSLPDIHSNFINCVRFSKDGSKIVSVGSDKKIAFYDGATGEFLDAIENAHEGSITSVSWSPDGSQILTASADKTVKLWNVETKEPVSTFETSSDPSVKDMKVFVEWRQDGTAITTDLSGDLIELDLQNPTTPKRVWQGHQTAIACMDHSSEGDMVVTASLDGRTIIWKDKKPSQMGGDCHTKRVVDIAILKDQVVSIGWDDSIRFGNVHDGQYTESSALPQQPQQLAVCEVAGEILAAVQVEDGIVMVKDGKITSKVSDLDFSPSAVALSQDGSELAVGSKDDNKVRLYLLSPDGGIAQETGQLVGHRGAISAIAYSPDGTQLATADVLKEVCLFDRASQQAIVQSRWVAHSTRVNTLAFSPDGQRVASGGVDDHIFIWNIKTRRKEKDLALSHGGGVSSVKWVSESVLVSAGIDGCVKRWDITK